MLRIFYFDVEVLNEALEKAPPPPFWMYIQYICVAMKTKNLLANVSGVIKYILP